MFPSPLLPLYTVKDIGETRMTSLKWGLRSPQRMIYWRLPEKTRYCECPRQTVSIIVDWTNAKWKWLRYLIFVNISPWPGGWPNELGREAARTMDVPWPKDPDQSTEQYNWRRRRFPNPTNYFHIKTPRFRHANRAKTARTRPELQHRPHDSGKLMITIVFEN